MLHNSDISVIIRLMLTMTPHTSKCQSRKINELEHFLMINKNRTDAYNGQVDRNVIDSSHKACFFIGHRTAGAEVKPLLLKAIERHITEYRVTDFYVGHYGAFDSMAAGALYEMKERYPYIKNYLLLAYHPAVRKIDLPKGFDSTLLLDGQEKSPPRYAITNLNKRIVREVDYLIAFVRHITDGSYNLLDYAMKRERQGRLIITNFADRPPTIDYIYKTC